MKKTVNLLLAMVVGLSLASSFVLTSCGKTSTCDTLTDPNGLLSTPYTDKLAFPYEADYKTKDFAAPTSGLAYGVATLKSVTDGDTANFLTKDGTYIKCRFLGINTPESTAKVEAWGVKASKWMASVFNAATDFCLVDDIDVYDKLDSSGTRCLSFVWYKTAATDSKAASWRLYNLECVEQCYSKNLLFEDSSKLNYLTSFTEAGKKAATCGYRVNGASDPDFDSSTTIIETDVYYIRHHFSDVGINFDTGSSGYYLHMTELVVGMIGDNLVVRDLKLNDEQASTDNLECMYVYAGFNSSLASAVSVGDVVSFYCRASVFPKNTDNIQLTDICTSNYGKYKISITSPSDANYATLLNGVTYDADMNPLVPATTISSVTDLAKYFGYYAKIRVKVRTVKGSELDDDGNTVSVDSYHRETYNSSSGSLSATTIYCYVEGTTVSCNLRIDASSSPKLTYKDFNVDQVWDIKAYVAQYYTNYQLQLFNNVSGLGYATRVS